MFTNLSLDQSLKKAKFYSKKGEFKKAEKISKIRVKKKKVFFGKKKMFFFGSPGCVPLLWASPE